MVKPTKKSHIEAVHSLEPIQNQLGDLITLSAPLPVLVNNLSWSINKLVKEKYDLESWITKVINKTGFKSNHGLYSKEFRTQFELFIEKLPVPTPDSSDCENISTDEPEAEPERSLDSDKTGGVSEDKPNCEMSMETDKKINDLLAAVLARNAAETIPDIYKSAVKVSSEETRQKYRLKFSQFMADKEREKNTQERTDVVELHTSQSQLNLQPSPINQPMPLGRGLQPDAMSVGVQAGPSGDPRLARRIQGNGSGNKQNHSMRAISATESPSPRKLSLTAYKMRRNLQGGGNLQGQRDGEHPTQKRTRRL